MDRGSYGVSGEAERRGTAGGAGWPRYLEPLRPDQVTRQRLRQSVMAAAALFERRQPSWVNFATAWSAALAPLAAGLLVAAGVMAYRASSGTTAEGPEAAAGAGGTPANPEAGAASDAAPTWLVQSLAPDAAVPPELLIDFSEPSRDAILAAALLVP